MNSVLFYAPLRKKRVEIALPLEHNEDECELNSNEDELQEYLPGEFETDEEDESENQDEDESSESAITETCISSTV